MDKSTKISSNRQKKIDLTDKLSAKVAKSQSFVFTNYTGLTHQQLEGLKRGVKKLNAEFIVTKNTLLKRALSGMVSSRQLPLSSRASATSREISHTTSSSVVEIPHDVRNDNQVEMTLPSEIFSQPTATLFAYSDLIEPLKVITKLIKEINIPVIKAGFMDGQWLNEAQVTQLATLPAKPVLQAQLLGMMKSPIQNLHRSLNWQLQKFVMTLHAIEKTKS